VGQSAAQTHEPNHSERENHGGNHSAAEAIGGRQARKAWAKRCYPIETYFERDAIEKNESCSFRATFV
jgi:hypothetical protein